MAALEGLLLLRHGDEQFLLDLLADVSSEKMMDHFSYADALSFQCCVFKMVREMMPISSALSSNLQSKQLREYLEKALIGALISRNLPIFDAIVAMCQVAFAHPPADIREIPIEMEDGGF